MDIGGGSVEFIFASANGVEWAKSFPVGVAVLYRQFHQHEPILKTEVSATKDFLQGALTPLWEVFPSYPINCLVGAAGTFDVIADLMGTETPTANSHVIDLDAFDLLYQRCLKANKEERYEMDGIPANRADMIVVALILIKVVLEQIQPPQVLVSDYSMKEGILSEMLNR